MVNEKNDQPARAGIATDGQFARVVSRLQLTERALAGMLSIHDSVTQGQEREFREKWIPLARLIVANADAGLRGAEGTEAEALLADNARLRAALAIAADDLQRAAHWMADVGAPRATSAAQIMRWSDHARAALAAKREGGAA